jgi:hypothetical protein
MSTAGPSKNAAAGSTGHLRTDPLSRLSSIINGRCVRCRLLCLHRPADSKKSRLAPLWPEWNEADVNAESWESASTKKKDAGGSKTRTDVKSASSIVNRCIARVYCLLNAM